MDKEENMTEKNYLKLQINPRKTPIYTQIWNGFKRFPKNLAKGSDHPPKVSGSAAAALISAAIGCLTMMLSHHLADTSQAGENFIWLLGSWIPGSHNQNPVQGNLGSYSGQETVLLISWLMSWLLLHLLLKDRQVKTKTIFFWFFVLMIAATVMSWHPLFPYLPLS
jgi:hypothetical protein